MLTRRTLLGTSVFGGLSLAFGDIIAQNSSKLKQNNKKAICVWLGGGPPTIDMWDMKPHTTNGGPHMPINTTGDFQISELMPKLAKQGNDFSIIRSMMTREADHSRGTYYMHTGFKPSPNMTHPSIGSVVSKELGSYLTDLEIPPFFSVNTGSLGGGFLGSVYNPFVVNSRGQVRNLGSTNSIERLSFLSHIEKNFIEDKRGSLGRDHMSLLDKTLKLNLSPQMDALKIDNEINVYGDTDFGRSCLIARRLIQTGVPFVEVGFGGWDLHRNTHEILGDKLPELDHVLSTLFSELKKFDIWDNCVIMVLGEFGRTPRINQDAGRDHYASAWSVVLAGGLIQGGQSIGKTSNDGTTIESEPYTSEDIIATVCNCLDIDTNIVYTNNDGRPIKIANGGKIIW